MTPIKLKIMVKATELRMGKGEALEDILMGWPALTEADKAQIRAAVEVADAPESGGGTV